MASTDMRQKGESGFSLLEVMFASVIMVVGLLSVAYGVGVGLTVTITADYDAIARQKAREAMEDVFTARDDASITFDQVCNIGTGPTCIFINGPEAMLTAGADEIVNTADDGPSVETMQTPGPDGILGTADDVFIPLTNFTRQVQVTQISTDPPMKQISVTIQYTIRKGLTRSVTVTALMSPYV